MPASELEAIYSRIAKRIIPVLILLFVMAWMDRVNVGFARLQMLADRGFSDAVFGFGAGIFYFGYLLFEIPSNLLLQRIGAAKTLARIALLWGLTSIAMMFVKTATQFYVLRFMLGAFEAGLYPGVILYLTYWFPARHRAKMTGLFMTSIPAAGIVGGPISGWIMGAMGGRRAALPTVGPSRQTAGHCASGCGPTSPITTAHPSPPKSSHAWCGRGCRQRSVLRSRT